MPVSFEKEFEEWGEPEVRRKLLLPENKDSLLLKCAPAWLAKKEAERDLRQESIATTAASAATTAASEAVKANDWARKNRNNTIAAMLIAIAAAIAAIISAYAAMKGIK